MAALLLSGDGHRQAVPAASAQSSARRRLLEVCVSGEDVAHALPEAGDGEAAGAGELLTHQRFHSFADGHHPCGARKNKMFSDLKNACCHVSAMCAWRCCALWDLDEIFTGSI